MPMSGANGFKTLLFWLTILLGTAALAPCLIMPAWLERQAQLEYLKAHEEYLAGLRYRLRTTQKQIEHLNNDPAYLLRLAEQEFGGGIAVPNVETILIDPGPAVTSTPPPTITGADPNAPREEKLLPELAAILDQAMQRHPVAQIFVDARTRPLLMGIGGVLLLTGIVLLGLVGNRPVATPPSR